MQIQQEFTLHFIHKIALAVASATVLGGGTMVLASHTTNAAQEIRLEQIEAAIVRMNDIAEDIEQTNRKLEVTNTHLEYLRHERQSEVPRD